MIKKKINSLIKDKTKSNFFIYGLGQSFNLLSPLIIAPLVISVCGIEGFGKVGLGFALALFLILIVDYSFDIKGTKKVAEYRENKPAQENILFLAIFTKLILFVIASIIAILIVIFIPFFSQEKHLFLISLLIVFAQIFNPVWFLQGIENFKLVSIINICSKTLYVLLVFLLIREKTDYIWVNFYLGFSALIFNFLGLVIVFNKHKLKLYFPKKEEVIDVLQKDFTFCLSQLFLSARQLSPLVLTGYFLGYGFAGQYKVMEQVITLFRTFNQVYLKFFYPKGCYKYSIDKANGVLFWKKYSQLSFVFVFTGLSLIFIFSRETLSFFNLSEDVVNQINIIFRISLLVSFMLSLSLPLEQLMFISNQTKSYIRITIFVTTVNIILLLLLTEKYQLAGIILTLIVAELLFILLYFYNTFIKENIKKEYN
jgi:O-antigen/teichoic acid export membrane protein